MPLSDAKIRSAKPDAHPLKLTDSSGLYLEVRPTGAKLWRYRYRIAGKENVFAAGEYVQVPVGETDEQALARQYAGMLTLAEARAKRGEWKALVMQGIHPAQHRKMARIELSTRNASTFEAVAREWMGKKKEAWTPYYTRQVRRFLEADVFPVIGALPIRNVTAAHLLGILQQVEMRGAETVAVMLRQWISAVFRYAVATLRADTDPASALKGAIHRPRTKHAKPLSRTEIEAFAHALEAYGGYRTTVIALRLMLLTFVRTKELRAALWSEMDLDRAEWRIGANRMKMRKPHIVPLSRQAVALVRELQTYTGGCAFLFPNYRNPETCMTATTLNRALERMGFNGKNGIGFSAHGFRATASTILNETGFRPDVIERQLAHAERNKVRASYNQGQYLEERRDMMQQWADLTDEIARPESK
jgi:integrase